MTEQIFGRLLYLGLAVVGVAVVVLRERFVRNSFTTSRTLFRRDIRPGTREHTVMAWWTRIITTLGGTALAATGLLGTLGIIDRD